jgi:hypothetical protein
MSEKPQSERDLRQQEAHVARLIEELHGTETHLMRSLVQRLIDGFNLISSFTLSDDNEVQYACLLLCTKSTHSLWCAYSLATKGYYSQALALLRTVTEDFLLAKDCKGNPRTLQALLHDCEYRIGRQRDSLGYNQIASRLGMDRVLYEQDYRFQSEFLHTGRLSTRVLLTEDNQLVTAPIYKWVLFMAACESFVRNALRMLEVMEELLSQLRVANLQAWANNASPTARAGADWLRALQKTYGSVDDGQAQEPA